MTSVQFLYGNVETVGPELEGETLIMLFTAQQLKIAFI